MLRRTVSVCGTRNMNTIEQISSWKRTAGNCAGAGLSGIRHTGSKIQNKNIHTRYADELATVIKSEKIVQTHTGFMCRNCFGSNKHIRSCVAFVFHEPQSQLSPVSQQLLCICCLTFMHRASCILGQAFHYSPENAFYIFNQQIYFIIWYLLDRASLI